MARFARGGESFRHMARIGRHVVFVDMASRTACRCGRVIEHGA